MSAPGNERPPGTGAPHSAPGAGEVDVFERGAPRDGQPQRMDRRLFMQLLVVRSKADDGQLGRRIGEAIAATDTSVVVYEDVNHPQGYGILTFSENPSIFTQRVRPALRSPDLGRLVVREPFTMIGRSYSSGFESDLEYWLIRRPVDTALNEAWPWAVWYPLRRGGAFEQLEPREKGSIMREHAEIGKAYGTADLAHDIRLACHGLDQNDNEFVIGLVGKDLHPLSHVVQRMRSTQQTSRYIVQMGPFFVGHAVFRHRAAG